MTLLYLLLSLTFAKTPNACNQHSPMSPDVPVCPNTGSTLLSENYPIMAASVSDSQGGPQYVKAYVTKVLKAQADKPPQFFLHVTPETYEQVVTEIKKQAPNPQVASRWLASLSVVKTESRWNWQQDYFESFFDPASGKPVLREVEGYERHEDAFFDMIKQTQKDCSINEGPLLKNEEYKSGHSGGNIEAVNGLCLIGSDHFVNNEWDDYAKTTCKNTDVAVQTPSSFLKVGHTDEFFKTLKDPSQKAPCDFSLAFASPQKGLHLLKQNPNNRAFDFSNIPAEEIPARMSQGSYAEICSRHLELKRREDPSRQNTPQNEKSRRGISRLLLKWVLKYANASAEDAETRRFDKMLDDYNDMDARGPRSREDEQRTREEKAARKNRVRRLMLQSGLLKPPRSNDEIKECYSMTNRDLIKVIEADPEIADFNTAVEASIQNFKTELLTKLKTKYPQCSPKTIDMPDLFTGLMDSTQTPATYVMASGDSIFPNPTNGEIVGNTYLIPEPVNPAFKKDIDDSVRKLGLKTDYVDTHFAHVAMGNLHCSSHAMRYCRPQGGKK